MIAEAERRGWLRPGGTIIEATAGNTGVGLAMIAAVKGYRCIFVLPDKMSGEKVRLLKAYGAEVVITPTNVPPDSPDSYNGVADRLTREIPGAWRPNQFANLSNPDIHYRTTGMEIWEQTEGRVSAVVACVRTGGPLRGDTGRNYLSKFFDEAWLAANKLTTNVEVPHSIQDLLKSRGKRDLVTVTPKMTVSEAIALLQKTGISQLPVLQDGKPVGSI